MTSGRYHRSGSFGVNDDLESYFADARQHPLLDRDQERVLGAKMERSFKGISRAFHALPARDRPVLLAAAGIMTFRRGISTKTLSTLCSNVAQYAMQTGKTRHLKIAAAMAAAFNVYEAAHTKFVVSNLRLVVSLAKSYPVLGMQFSDLIQEGNIGLMAAVDRFNHRRRCKFSTYASWWIKQALKRAICDKSRVVRLPVHAHEKLFRVRNFQYEFRLANDRFPTDDEISRYLGISLEAVTQIQAFVEDVLSLDETVEQEKGGEVSRSYNIAEIHVLNPDEELDRDRLREVVRRLLVKCAAQDGGLRGMQVLSLRFGIGHDRQHTLEQVGRLFNVSRERIRQIQMEEFERLLEIAAEEGVDLTEYLRLL